MLEGMGRVWRHTGLLPNPRTRTNADYNLCHKYYHFQKGKKIA